MKEMVGGCCVCSDERGWPDNPLVYCDGNGCTVAVHQACYGIVTVPTGPWYCRKCESPETSKGKVRCELCPSRSGALKKADTGGWAHVVCALYIPEVRFGNVTSMEPIVLRLIPPERFTRTCYICTENGKAQRASQGACMACNKSGCKQQFHVTCAQSLGLLCEEAGNYLDNVKYCGYCQHHYSKLFTNHEVTVITKKKGGNVKTIPPYKPVAHDSHSSGSSSEKEGGASPIAGGIGTPTPHTKGSKGPGRKSSQNRDSSKNVHASKAAPPTTSQPMDKKKSPSRRQSSTSDGASTSKASTPARSPSQSADANSSKAAGSSSERGRESSSASRSTPPCASPRSKSPQTTGGVISTVASATLAASAAAVPTTSAGVTISVVQAPTNKPTVTFQESVITNTDAIETKHTKKRKAATAAATAAAEQAAQANANESPSRPAPVSEAASEIKHNKKRRAASAGSAAAPAAPASDDNGKKTQSTASESVASVEVETKYNKKRQAAAAASAAADAEKGAQTSASTSERQQTSLPSQWENSHSSNDAALSTDTSEKALKKSKTESNTPPHAHYSSPPTPTPPPPPPPPQFIRSSRLLTSPMPGQSGMNPPAALNPPSAIRSPSQHQGATEKPAPPSAHAFHQPSISAALEPGIPAHSPHAHSLRSNWGSLNVSYEMQQDPNKPGVSGVAGASKEHGGMPMPPAMRNKKRAAMANPPPPPPPSAHQMVPASIQGFASVRRHAPTPSQQQSMYQEVLNESPPVSPNTERLLKVKAEQQYYSRMLATAPHMLGNELNPESGAAARLQEQLNAELAAHAAGGAGPDPIVPPPLMNKAAPGTSSGRNTGAQNLDQLLERQWEQGSQFLMEQAQHFDIASLLSCLHQLRTENVRLEEHVANLLQRRDHLLAVNARLAIPLNAGGVADSAYHLTFQGTAQGTEQGRAARENPPAARGPPASARMPAPPARAADPAAERDRHDRHAERAQQLSHQMLMREAQQKPS